MATSTDLINDVYDHFSQAYASVTAKGSVVIAFEPLGISPGLDPSAPGATVTALEFLSTNANMVPDLSGGMFVPTTRTISGTYNTMLQGAGPSPSSDPAMFNTVKASAREIYANVTSGSLLGAFSYLPVFASPANWYDPSVESNWFSYSYDASTQSANGASGTSGAGTASAGGGPGVHPPPRMIPPPWRLTSRAGVRSPIAAVMSEPVRGLTAQTPALPDVAAQHLPLAGSAALNSLVVNNEAAHPVLAPEFTMTFDYCMIALERPWWSGDFLATPGWYVPGAHAGDYAAPPAPAKTGAAAGAAPPAAGATSAGTPGVATTATAPAKVAPLSWIPVACIAVKNLVISAQGTNAAPADNSNLAAFGPFALSADSDGLRHPGIQIIAWVCSTQPLLPPDTDPALLPPTTTQTVVKDAGVAVDVFQQLMSVLGKH